MPAMAIAASLKGTRACPHCDSANIDAKPRPKSPSPEKENT